MHWVIAQLLAIKGHSLLQSCWCLAGASNWWMMLTKWAEQLNFIALQHRVLVPVFTVGRGKGQDEDTAMHLQLDQSLFFFHLCVG